MTAEHQEVPETFGELAKQIGHLWLIYLRGQFLQSIIMGFITWVVGAAIGLQHAFFLGLLAGLLDTVPTIGAAVATIPAIAVALIYGSEVIPVEDWIFGLIVVAVYLIIQQVGELLIRPHLMGRSLHLPPLVVFVAIVIGAIVANVAGAYLAVPLLVAVREIIRYVRHKWRAAPPPSHSA